MTRSLRRALSLCLLAVLLVSGGLLADRLLDYQKGESIYQEARLIAGLDEPRVPLAQGPAAEPAPFPLTDLPPGLLDPDWAALQSVSPDVVGWLTIPGVLSYPLVQGADNDYYLNHTWDGQASAVGAVFLDARNSPDWSDANTILYGHRMGDGSMFHPLLDYKDPAFFSAHPHLYVAAPEGLRRYTVFAAWETRTIEPYQIDHSAAGEAPSLTLSTCTGRGHASRWVVQGVLDGFLPN